MAREIINMLIDYELAVSELYRACADKFSEHKDFWNELADEEIIHADNIRKLTEVALSGNAQVNEMAFAKRPLEISIEYAKEITERVKENKIDILSVLSLSYDIENSLIESEYHKVFKGKDSEANKFILNIHNESAEHRERVKKKKEQILEQKKNEKLERWD